VAKDSERGSGNGFDDCCMALGPGTCRGKYGVATSRFGRSGVLMLEPYSSDVAEGLFGTLVEVVDADRDASPEASPEQEERDDNDPSH